jgi:threonine/homoserine/homoserine lactone efflux protein
MFENAFLGIGFAFSAALQPGPLQAFLLSRVAAVGWKRTLPASLAPLISDIPVAFIVLVVIGTLPLVAQQSLRAAGGCFLLYLAWLTIRSIKRSENSAAERLDSAPQTVLQAALVNILNPNPYIGWTLVLGPAVIAAWQRHPVEAVVLIIAFYGTMVVSLAASIFLFGTARFLNARGQRLLIVLSAISLAVLGLYQLVAGVRELTKL